MISNRLIDSIKSVVFRKKLAEEQGAAEQVMHVLTRGREVDLRGADLRNVDMGQFNLTARCREQSSQKLQVPCSLCFRGCHGAGVPEKKQEKDNEQ